MHGGIRDVTEKEAALCKKDRKGAIISPPHSKKLCCVKPTMKRIFEVWKYK